MLTHKQLPDAQIPLIGPFSENGLKHYVTAVDSKPWPLVCADGGLLVFYRFDDVTQVSQLAAKLTTGMLQLYYIDQQWHGCLKYGCGWEIRPHWSEALLGLYRTDRYLKLFDEFTKEAMQWFRQFSEVESLSWRDSKIWNVTELKESTHTPIPSENLKSNISIIQTGQNRFSQLMSITSLDLIPLKRGLLDDETIKVISIMKIPKEQESEMKNRAMDRMKVMRCLSPKKRKVARVHTILDEEDVTQLARDKLYYIDVQLLIHTTNNLQELQTKENQLRERLGAHDVSIYTPTNGQRRQYVSILPGLCYYSETAQLARKKFVDKALFRMVNL